jgi:RNA polymerase sigma-70 factor, ECF subfamily
MVVEELTVLDEIEQVYRERGTKLLRALYAHTGSVEIAEDAAVEAFAQALRLRDQIRDVERWIWRVAFRKAARELRTKGYPADTDRTASYEMTDAAIDLVTALRRLSPKQRSSVILHHYAGYPIRDVATILGTTSAAVKVHLSVGRRRLRVLLEERDG